MNTTLSALNYFRELSRIPRIPLHEEKARNWIISWAQERWWEYQTDTIGNLLVIAPGDQAKTLCLQAHLDMVCVAEGNHNFHAQGVTIKEKEGIMTAHKTSLWADNGIGVATMMALAEIANRPTLELLFTIGEEVWLVGAQNITLPITASEAINLDWSDSETIGTGCGGTLLVQWERTLNTLSSETHTQKDALFCIRLFGMQWGHSGEDIRHYRGNALIEILKVIQELPSITHIGEIIGGEADNAIPHSAKVIVSYSGHPNLLRNELSHLQKLLRTKYKHDTISLSVEQIDTDIPLYERALLLPIISEILDVWTGVQVWWKANTPLSSWNLGILSLKKKILSLHYFLRTNIEDGIEPMKNDIINWLSDTTWTLSHESPPWCSHLTSSLLRDIQETFVDEEEIPLPLITTHATVEAGLLSKKYPQTEWVSVGATISDMHTTRESLRIKDFEEFVEKLERLITRT